MRGNSPRIDADSIAKSGGISPLGRCDSPNENGEEPVIEESALSALGEGCFDLKKVFSLETQDLFNAIEQVRDPEGRAALYDFFGAVTALVEYQRSRNRENFKGECELQKRVSRALQRVDEHIDDPRVEDALLLIALLKSVAG